MGGDTLLTMNTWILGVDFLCIKIIHSNVKHLYLILSSFGNFRRKIGPPTSWRPSYGKYWFCSCITLLTIRGNKCKSTKLNLQTKSKNAFSLMHKSHCIFRIIQLKSYKMNLAQFLSANCHINSKNYLSTFASLISQIITRITNIALCGII